MRLVVDTSVMIRALRSAGPARAFFKAAPLSHTLMYHPEQLLELREVAARPRLAIAPEEVDELIQRIERYGQKVESVLDAPGDCRDPNDEYLLALALAGAAAAIITEDLDLLVLNPRRGVRILRLFEFVAEHPLSDV